jgi:flagellar hook-associated protein 3 FlgL
MTLINISNKSPILSNLSQQLGQLEDLQRKIGTGRESDTYSGLGTKRTTSLNMRAQVSKIEAYQTTISDVNIRMDLMLTSLDRLDQIAADTRNEALPLGFSLQNGEQTVEQLGAGARLDEAINLLNQDVNGRYLFAGRATNIKPVQTENVIMNGQGTQAGFTQLADERLLADLGGALTDTQITGRVDLSVATDTVSLTQSGGTFGFQFNAQSFFSSNPAAIAVAPPAGAPPASNVQFLAVPTQGDQVRFTLDLPDGSQSVVTLTATTSTPVRDDEFLIGADVNTTAQNFLASAQNALNLEARTTLAAASRVQAGSDFFDSDPPLRVTPALTERIGVNTVTDTVTLSENSSSFGYSFATPAFAASNAGTVTLTPPAGTPASGTIQFTSAPSDGDTYDVNLNDDQGNPVTIQLTAIAAGPPNPGEFVLDADLTVTAANFDAAFQAALDAQAGPEIAAATSLAADSVNTVRWYVGETGTDDPRDTALARIDDDVSIGYGARANEGPLSSVVKQLAVFSSFTFDMADETSSQRYNAIASRVRENLADPSGRNLPRAISTDINLAQNLAASTNSRHDDAIGILGNIVSDIESANTEEAAVRLLKLQTQLQASYSVTATLNRLSLVNFL